MGIFSRIKGGLSSKANAALDKAIDPGKELDLAILELEEGRKKALAELVSYKAAAKQMDADVARHRAKAQDWERRAMLALKAGDEDAAREALRQKKAAEAEAVKIERDKHEAASYAVQLNKSRKEFETRLQMLKLRRGTLATQLAAARSGGGDAFGNDDGVWDRFKVAEERIDQESIASEVDAAMRGEDAEARMLDSRLAAAASAAGLPASGDPDAADPLAQLKARMAADKAARQRALPASVPTKEHAGAAGDGPVAAARTPADVPAAPASAGEGPGALTPAASGPAAPIDTSKVEAELAALRAAAARGELDEP